MWLRQSEGEGEREGMRAERGRGRLCRALWEELGLVPLREVGVLGTRQHRSHLDFKRVILNSFL